MARLLERGGIQSRANRAQRITSRQSKLGRASGFDPGSNRHMSEAIAVAGNQSLPLQQLETRPYPVGRQGIDSAGVHVGSKWVVVIALAAFAVLAPRSFSYTTSSWLTMNVITPEDRYRAG